MLHVLTITNDDMTHLKLAHCFVVFILMFAGVVYTRSVFA